MSDLPLISVIVPVYNVEKYLRKCLDSICGQTYRNLEILCVNDGSTDGSAAILDEYAAKDARIKVLTQKNAGLSAARNTGLEYATGEWITGVDSDDYLELDTYEYALARTDDETDIICFGTRVIWQDVPKDARMEEYFELTHKDGAPSFEALIQTPVTFWNKLWRSSLVKQNPVIFPVGLWYEDTHFFFALAPFARKIAYRPEKKYQYVRRPGSIMSETSAFNPKVFDRLRIAAETLEFYRKNPLPSHLRHIRLFVFTTNLGSALEYIPKSRLKSFFRLAFEVAKQYGLMQQYPARLRFLNPVPWFLMPFVRHQVRKSYYGLPGLPLLTITRKPDKEVLRFLGISIPSFARDESYSHGIVL